MKLNKKGFTLVELLAVLLILALLVVLVIPSVLNILNNSKAKTYDILKKNVQVAAENYVNECTTNSTLYKVYIPTETTSINTIVTNYQSINSNLDIYDVCFANNITDCSNSITFPSEKQVKIPFICNRITNNTTLTALELAHNGFLKSTVEDNGNRKIIRSTDDEDVSTCLKVLITYDNAKYKHSYTIADGSCEVSPSTEKTYVINNLVNNGDFENGVTGWSRGTLYNTGGINNSKYIRITPTTTYYYARSNSFIIPYQHKIYTKAYYKKSGGGNTRTLVYNSDTAYGFGSILPSADTSTWTPVSIIAINNRSDVTSFKFLLYGAGSSYIESMYTEWDNAIAIDLTEDFGAGNEPSKEWCDANINYFDGSIIITK